MSVDFREWNVKLQEQCIDNICSIFNKYNIPYRRDKLNRPRQQITLLPYANHAGFATQTDALLAVFAEKQTEIEMLKNELYKLRGMTKSEWRRISKSCAEELVNPVQTKQMSFSGRALFFDLHTKQTFSVTPQQYAKAQKDFEYWNEQIRKSGKVGTVDFVIETETGRHWPWVYRPDEDYSKYEVSK